MTENLERSLWQPQKKLKNKNKGTVRYGLCHFFAFMPKLKWDKIGIFFKCMFIFC